MAKMILSMDGLVLKEIELTKERITIGRRPHNDVVIDNLAVSGEHAVVVTILRDSFLEDMGSTNGTMVNGQAIKKHFLQNNDVVELGKYKLKYVADPKQDSNATDFGKRALRTLTGATTSQIQSEAQQAAPTTTQSRAPNTASQVSKAAATSHTNSNPNLRSSISGSNPGANSSHTATTAGLSGQAPAAVIQILNGPNAGKELMLSKALTTLGRPGVQVAVITRRPQGYFLTHVEGSTFPVVNGKTLGAEAHAVNDHDIIELSGTKMEFFYQ